MRGHIYRRCPKPLGKSCAAGRCEHRWAYTFTAGVDGRGKRRQFTSSVHRTRGDAEKALRAAITAAEKGVLLSRREQRERDRAAAAELDAAVTVAAYLEGWLASRAGLRPASRDAYGTNITLHITPVIGTIPLRNVTAADVRRVLSTMTRPDPDTGKVRKPATIARVRATLTSAFRTAVLDELIARNPATGVPLPEQPHDLEAPQTIQVWTPQQIGAFLATVGADPLFALLHVAAHTGARRGEILGLTWADVDLTAGQVTIRRTVSHRKGEVRVGRPKTKAGERVIALDAGTVDVLRRHRIDHAAERLAWAGARNDGDRVFCWPDGRPIRGDYLTRRFEALAAAAGLPVIRFHDLRHTHASAALAAGVPIKVVSDRLGHSTTKITEDIYQHVVPQLAADAAELIAALTRGGTSKTASKDPS